MVNKLLVKRQLKQKEREQLFVNMYLKELKESFFSEGNLNRKEKFIVVNIDLFINKFQGFT